MRWRKRSLRTAVVVQTTGARGGILRRLSCRSTREQDCSWRAERENMNEPDLAWSLLRSARTIAVVGYSLRPDRPSNSVSAYLRRHGYRIIPVNPQLRGATVDGEQGYDRLRGIPASEQIDFVD